MKLHSLWTPLMLGALGTLAAPVSAQDPAEAGSGQGIQSRTIEGDRQTRLTLKLKDRLLRDVVNNIRRKAGVNIIIDETLEDRVTIDLEDVEWRQALDLVAESAGCVVVEEAGNVLKVEKPPRVYFAFENADIGKVIDTIGKISGANIVISPNVEGTITLRLKDIPWRDALEATVKTLGYVVVEEERGILRVVERADLTQDLVRESFQLRFVRPRSAYLPFLDSEYVRFTDPQALNGQVAGQQGSGFQLIDALQRLSTPEIGSLEYFEEQNLIIVRDTKPVVDEIRRIIQDLDVEPGQIFMDVKFVTTSNQDVLDFGVDPGASGWIAQIGLSQIPITLPFELGAGGFEDDIIAVSDFTQNSPLTGTPPNLNQGAGPFADIAANLPAQVSSPNVIFGALDFTQVTAALRLLKQDSYSEIIQAPKIIALNHHEATIFVGETVRYAQARAEQGQAGGLQLVVEEAPGSPVSVGFQLLTIPHIVPGTDKVIMDIIPKSDALSGTGQTNLAPPGFDVFTVGSGTGEGTIALPRVASSTIATKVLLRSGQTAVLGGLVTDNNSLSKTRIPLLGDIPILGWLFKRENSQKSRTTLIVFITPQIIRSPEDVENNLSEILRQRQELMENELDAIFGRD